MSTSEKPDSEAELRDVLHAWRVDATPSPRFEQAVWRRIAQGETAPGFAGGLFRFFERVFPKPAVAFSYIAILVGVGAGLGYLRSGQHKIEAQSQFESLYVQSVNPYHGVPGRL